MRCRAVGPSGSESHILSRQDGPVQSHLEGAGEKTPGGLRISAGQSSGRRGWIWKSQGRPLAPVLHPEFVFPS